MRVWPGRPYPLGATWDGSGSQLRPLLRACHEGRAVPVRFAPTPTKETQRIALPEQTDQVWHGYLPDVRPGQLYGYRVHGPYEPAEGPPLQSEQGRCSIRTPRRSAASCSWDDCAVRLQDRRPGRPTCRSTSATAPPSRRWRRWSTTAFTWGDDRPPRTPWHKTLIYETARQGLHQAASRGAREAARHLRRPGVASRRSSTCRTWASRPSSCCRSTSTSTTGTWSSKGLVNYWGYNTLGFFAPEPRYAVDRSAARRGPRVQDDGPRAARRRASR